MFLQSDVAGIIWLIYYFDKKINCLRSSTIKQLKFPLTYIVRSSSECPECSVRNLYIARDGFKLLIIVDQISHTFRFLLLVICWIKWICKFEIRKHKHPPFFHQRNNPYYFFRANQQKVNCEIYSLTQCGLTVNECDWQILAGNDDRIVVHCQTRKVWIHQIVLLYKCWHFMSHIHKFWYFTQMRNCLVILGVLSILQFSTCLDENSGYLVCHRSKQCSMFRAFVHVWWPLITGKLLEINCMK